MATTNEITTGIREEFREAAFCFGAAGGFAALAAAGAALLRFTVSHPSIDPVTSGTLFIIGAAACGIGSFASLVCAGLGIEKTIKGVSAPQRKAPSNKEPGIIILAP
jgi:hypothetical protein